MTLRRILQVISMVWLLVVIGAPTLFLSGHLNLDQTKRWMLVGTIGWFVVTPLWMERARGPAKAKKAAEQ